MKVERIVADTLPHNSPSSIERIVRGEKETLTTDAVTFDKERRQGDSNQNFEKENPAKEETAQTSPPLPQKETDGSIERKIDIVA